MITGARISNFKGISSCSVDNTNLVNVLIGKNNACKSTILEAMYYTLKEFTAPNLKEALYRRTNMQIYGTHMWYDYKTQNPATTRVNFDGEIGLTMNLAFDRTYIRSSLSVSTQEQTSELLAHAYYNISMELTSQVGYGQNELPVPGNRREGIWNCLNACTLLDSSTKSNVSSMERLFGRLKLRGMADRFGIILNDIFGIGRSWEFMNPSEENLSEFRAATKLNDHILYLDGLGDGMRYCIQIIGNMLLLNSTVIFIEEIENNQHEASLKKLISEVVKLSIANNIQLFITTHNYQAWTLLETEFEKNLKVKLGEENSQLQSYVVRRNLQNGTMSCLRKTTENANEFWRRAYEELTDTPAQF